MALGMSPRPYRAMRELLQSTHDPLPGKLEITKEGLVHDLMPSNGRHELTRAHLRKRLETALPEASLLPTRASPTWKTSRKESCAAPTSW